MDEKLILLCRLNDKTPMELFCLLKSYIGGHAVAPVEFDNEEFVELANDKLLPCV